MKNEIKSGEFTIENQILKIDNKTININHIDNMEIFPIKRYSLINGVNTWVKVWLVFLLIMAIFFKNNTILEITFTIYTFSIILLLFYNFKKHQQQFYAFCITTSRTTINIISESRDFLQEIHDIITKSMNSNNVNYTINLDNRAINNGIVNNGNHNKNKVIYNDNNK